jgi:hypothetical protein
MATVRARDSRSFPQLPEAFQQRLHRAVSSWPEVHKVSWAISASAS